MSYKPIDTFPRRGPNPPFPGLKETRSRDLTACPVPKNGPLDGRPASSSDFETAAVTIRGIPVGRKNQKHPFNLEPLADKPTGAPEFGPRFWLHKIYKTISRTKKYTSGK